jgi:hypothetical protein
MSRKTDQDKFCFYTVGYRGGWVHAHSERVTKGAIVERFKWRIGDASGTAKSLRAAKSQIQQAIKNGAQANG